MQRLLVKLFYNVGTHLRLWIGIAVALLIVVLLVRSTTFFTTSYYRVKENEADRGARVVPQDQLGDSFNKVVYLKQNWAPADSLWFYNTTQGSDLLPYDFFLVLEQKDSTELFRSDANMNRFRYLPQQKTSSNPHALPVGMVADTYRGKRYMGFTCAACHTGQINYNGTGIRIDGGPGAGDMESFMKELSAALWQTNDDATKRQRFIAAVLKEGDYKTKEEIGDDLKKYALRVGAYVFFNESFTHDEEGNTSPVPYGYFRLDAFGRIYNRVLEHIMSPRVLESILVDVLDPAELQTVTRTLEAVISNDDRDHIMEKLMGVLPQDKRDALRDEIFNPPNAPVSYPFLWDIPQSDYVQWNGIAGNSGLGPVGRNTGEVIGVFATLDWAEKNGWTISSVLGGQGFGKTHISFRSSANVHNIRLIESKLISLQSPTWNDAVELAGLPRVDPEKVKRGQKQFDKFCVGCHARIDRESDDRRVIADMESLDKIKTDEGMAANSVDYTGYSGILRNWYISTPVGKLLMTRHAPVAALLTKATENVVATPDPDKWFFTRGADWAIDLINQFRENKIKGSVKMGHYQPDTTAAPYASLRSYKGRSLNGIWATAPYLHNGSVPTLYDLLLPVEERPKEFQVGSRELDVVKVGLKSEGYKGFTFKTSLPANSNAGHEYGTRAMSHEDRMDLVEYLKTL